MAKTTKKGSTTKAAAPVEVLDPEPAEVALIATESLGIVDWLRSLSTFFRAAQQIERAAVARRDAMFKRAVPTTKEEDAALRQEVIACREERKAATAHWEVITSALSKLHRMTTAGRARATDPLEAAEKKGTALHTTYNDNELRASREREAVERRKQEAQAEQDRLAKLAEFERAAVAAEEASPLLSAREALWMDHYMRTGDGVRAAQVAGYADPAGQAARLVASEKMRAAIEAKRTATTMRTQIDVMKEMPVYVDEGKIEDAATPQINKGDREQWSASCIDLEAFRDAAFEGRAGIPRDIFVVDPAALNRAARSLGQRVEMWPGIKATKNTTVLR